MFSIKQFEKVINSINPSQAQVDNFKSALTSTPSYGRNIGGAFVGDTDPEESETAFQLGVMVGSESSGPGVTIDNFAQVTDEEIMRAGVLSMERDNGPLDRKVENSPALQEITLTALKSLATGSDRAPTLREVGGAIETVLKIGIALGLQLAESGSASSAAVSAA